MIKKKKILIIYATAGIGHKKAAIAIQKAIQELSPNDVDIVLIDSLDYTNAFFKWSYLQLYLLAMSKLQKAWGFMYYLTDNPAVNVIVSKIRRLSNTINGRRLVRYVDSEKPDVIISTHFFASEVIAALKRACRTEAKLVTVVTDYRLHSWWVGSDVDTYIVSNRAAADDLVRWKVSEARIKITGIPVEPIFSKALDRAKILAAVGLSPETFTVLVIGGGFGVGPIESIVEAIKALPVKAQAIIVCGHNRQLAERVTAMGSNDRVKIKTTGFIDNVYDYMEVSDILISKSGGITVSESIEKELPMIVISPIPGQETGNAAFLLAHGAAFMVDAASELSPILQELATHPDRIARLKTAIRAIKTPRSSHLIAVYVLELARKIGGVDVR